MSISQVSAAALELLTTYPSLTIAVLLLLVLGYSIYSSFLGGSAGNNPLKDDQRRRPEPFVRDAKLRDAILKNKYKPAKVPDNLDVIIIGSGAGGLSAGALLAKAGKRVLILEQHDQAGGCCHSFVEKGFEFDTGIHYVGGLQEGETVRVLLDQLTCGQLRWARMDDEFDTVVVGKSSNVKRFPMTSVKGQYYKNLIKLFPQERTAILAWRDLIRDASNSFSGILLLKILPRRLVNLVVSTGLYRLLMKGYRKGYATKSLQEVLDGLTDNKELKLVLSYICGDYGVFPKDAPFFLHATLVNHYKGGSYYPANGTSEIAFHMIKVIKQAGGKVLVQAPVTDILCDSNGRAMGVRVGKDEVDIHARYIISDAGVVNTFKKLLPERVARTSDIYPLIKKVGQSYAFLSAFIGVEGSTSELNLPAGNLWLYNAEDINKSLAEYLNIQPENVDTVDIPFAFISFPSAKDPEWENKFPGKSSVLIITLARWEWFEEWKNEKVRHRGDRYEGIKDILGRKMWQQCVDLYPQLDGKVCVEVTIKFNSGNESPATDGTFMVKVGNFNKVYMEVGTPVTNNHYMACPRGEMYGLDHKLSRFSADVFSKLRPETDIQGLYLTGQDTLSCGFLPAVLTGLLCASKILNRNIFADLGNLAKKIGKTDPGNNRAVLKKKE